MHKKAIFKKEGYIDIHSHILPGVDDGAQDMETSLGMLYLAQQEGISRIILTPHFKPGRHNASPVKVGQLCRRLQEAAEKEGLVVRLSIGNEVLYQRDMAELLDAGEILTLAESRYVLTEFLPGEGWEEIRNAAYRLLSGGYLPVIAHAERCRSLVKDRGRAGELIQLGAYIQVNAGSILGKYGHEAKVFTRKLLKEEAVHFVATDAHDMGKRAPQMRECGQHLARKYGRTYAEALLVGNPEAVLAGEYI